MKRILLFLLIVHFSVPPASEAQRGPELRPGDRVRIFAPVCSITTQDLRFSSLSRDTLWIADGMQEVGCATSGITKLDVFHPVSPWATAGIGLLVGTVGGAFIGRRTHSCGEDTECINHFYGWVGGGMIGAPVGFAIGMIIGLTHKLGRWEQVPLPLVEIHLDRALDDTNTLGLSIPLRK